MFILDTNTLIYFFKGIGNVSKRLLSTPPVEIGIPSIVIFELEAGIRSSKSPQKRRTQFQEFVSLVTEFPFGRSEAVSAAQIKIDLTRKGTPIGPYDLLVAATAVANHGTLISHNVAEFARVDGLKLDDWF